MAIIECEQCGAVFPATSDELRYGIALCPSCGNGISTRSAKRGFTAQEVEDAFFATRIDGCVGDVVEGILTAEDAMSRWAFDQVDGAYDDVGRVNWEFQRLTEIAKARYARGKCALRIGRVISCKREGGHSSPVSAVSPSVIVKWQRQEYWAALERAAGNAVEERAAQESPLGSREDRYHRGRHGFLEDEYGNVWDPDTGWMGPEDAWALRRELDAQDGDSVNLDD